MFPGVWTLLAYLWVTPLVSCLARLPHYKCLGLVDSGATRVVGGLSWWLDLV